MQSNGGVTAPERARAKAPARSDANAGDANAAPVQGFFAARERGTTEGVVSADGGQSVVASSAPSAKAGARGLPSERSAVSDTWSGFDSRAYVAGPAPVGPSFETEGESKLAMALLGAGLIGAVGTLLLAVPRRRRAEAHSGARGDAQGQ